MKVPVELAYLNGPHFHVTGKSGINMKDRLDTRDKSLAGLKLEWDPATKELAITYMGRTGYVVSSNVRAYFPFAESPVAEVKPLPKPEASGKVITAQVETPQSHVFAGPGGGKVK